MSLLKNCEFHICTTAITGTADSDIDGLTLDMAGYEGVLFVIPVIASSATTDTLLGIVGAESSCSGGGFVDYTSASGQVKFVSTASNVGDDTLVILDVYNPKDRWIRPTIISTTEMMKGTCIAIQYGARKGVVSQTTTTDGVIASAAFATPTTA